MKNASKNRYENLSFVGYFLTFIFHCFFVLKLTTISLSKNYFKFLLSTLMNSCIVFTACNAAHKYCLTDVWYGCNGVT